MFLKKKLTKYKNNENKIKTIKAKYNIQHHQQQNMGFCLFRILRLLCNVTNRDEPNKVIKYQIDLVESDIPSSKTHFMCHIEPRSQLFF